MAETKTKTSRTTKSTKTTTKPATKKTTVKKADTTKKIPSQPKKVDTKKKTEKTALSPGAKKVYDVFVGHEHFFELFCEGYLHRHRDEYGEPHIRQKTRDKGVDIICVKKDEWDSIDTVYYISCKNKESIGSEIVDSIVGAMQKFIPHYGDEDTKHIAMIMTSGVLTADAKKVRRALNVEVIDGNKLAKEKRIG